MQSPGLGLALATFLLAACGDANLLPPATVPTIEDTVTLWALTGTDVAFPSAYDIIAAERVRTDQTGTFDFIFDFRPVGDDSVPVPVLVPRGAEGLTADVGIMRTTARFDTLRLAPIEGYEFHAPVPVDTGTVLFVRSRLQTCNYSLNYGLYGKLQPLAISTSERWIQFKLRYDPNCGYRGLGPGVPTR
jgi:hypothetical protein